MQLSFGQYIQQQREKLGLQQEEIADFGQPYISDIENGRKRPVKRKTIEKLAEALQLREDQVTWLWVYSLLNEEPTSFFARYGFHNGKTPHNPGFMFSEEQRAVYENHLEHEIAVGMTPSDIRAKFGKPDKSVRFGTQRKWIYQEEGIHVLFEDDLVVDVIFK